MTHLLFFLLGLFVGNLGVLWCLAIIRSGREEEPTEQKKQTHPGGWLKCQCPECAKHRDGMQNTFDKHFPEEQGPYEQSR